MKKFIGILISILIFGCAYAQSANVITDILETEKVTYGQICYLAAVQQNFITETATYEEAVTVLFEQNIIPEKVSSTDVIPVGNVAYIFAKMWNVKGGIFYKLTKGSPRYAFKQLKQDGVIAENMDPSFYISGVDALGIFTDCSFVYGKVEIGM